MHKRGSEVSLSRDMIIDIRRARSEVACNIGVVLEFDGYGYSSC